MLEREIKTLSKQVLDLFEKGANGFSFPVEVSEKNKIRYLGLKGGVSPPV